MSRLIRKRIEKEFFQNSAISIEWEIQGQKIVNGLPVIGARAGPSVDVWNLFHEMAHFVEIDDERMRMGSWGLRLPEVFIFDRICVDPRTIQMTEREIRTIAYLRNVMKYLGIEEDSMKSVSSLCFMPDFVLVPIEDGTTAWGRKTDNWDREQIKNSQLKWIANQVENLQSKYTLDLFISEWKRKNKLLLQQKDK